MGEDMDDILKIFFEECDEYLPNLEDGLNTVSSGKYTQEDINAIFRAIHSIKGGAAAFGLERLVYFAHIYESGLDKLRANHIAPTPEIVKAFLLATDVLSDLVSEAKKVISAVEDDRIEESLENLKLATTLPNAAQRNSEDENAEDPLLNFKPVAVDLDKLDASLHEAHGGNHQDNAPPLEKDKKSQHSFFITLVPYKQCSFSHADALRGIYALRDLLPEEDKNTLSAKCFFDEEDNIKLFDGSSLPSWEIKVPSCEHISQEDILDALYDASKIYTINIVEMSFHENNKLSSESYFRLEGKPLNDNELNLDTHITPNDISSHIQSKKDALNSISVRVDTEQISSLMNRVGEVAVSQAALERALKKCKSCVDPLVHHQIKTMKAHVQEIQNDLISMRAQPVKNVFQRMMRVVREASSLAEKDVQLIIEGEDTEVDRTLIENLSDPLTHLLRNAVAHGIETAEKRALSGKSEKGTIWLSAFHNSGRILIKIRDDGAGINQKKVRDIAIKKGIITAEHNLKPSEINELICTPGFSTAETVSDLSGRGVGMDVVRDAVHALGGHVWIKSVEGEGTIFTLSLPLTLAVLDGMLIEYKNYIMVVPAASVVGMARVSDTYIPTDRQGVVSINGEYLPLIHLSDTLKLPRKCTQFAAIRNEQAVFLVVENEEGVRGALAVDQAYDQTQVVIKNIEKNYSHLEGVSASTILADGSVTLILDVSALISKATRGFDA